MHIQNITVGDRLEAVRVMFRLEMKYFAKKLNISEYAYRQMKLNKKQIDLGTVTQVMQKYKINPDWLLFGIGEMIKDR